mgnify:CR=1 FL=1
MIIIYNTRISVQENIVNTNDIDNKKLLKWNE